MLNYRGKSNASISLNLTSFSMHNWRRGNYCGTKGDNEDKVDHVKTNTADGAVAIAMPKLLF